MASLLLALLLTSSAAPGDGGTADVALEQRTREVMHTLVTVALPDSIPGAEREAAFTEAFAVFEDIDRSLNEWRPDSALSKVNAGAGGPGVEAPPQVCEVVQLALDGAKKTGGLFDPTWASVRGLWRFGTDETGEVPTDEQVRTACPAVGWKKVTVTPLRAPTAEAACRIRLATKATQLGLGGLVKGWGVDQVVRRFRKRGYATFFVQAGGDLYLAGSPRPVGIREPRGDAAEAFARVPVGDAAFSTSGDYEHFFLKDGVRYHHLLDPRTCRPANASVSVSVLAKSAIDSEFLTKAGFILGPKKGVALMRAWGAEAVWVTPDGKVTTTPGLSARVRVTPPLGFTPDAGK